MSKFFYHGKANNNNERGSSSFGGNKSVKLGTDKSPAMLSVQTQARQKEIEAILAENKWVGEVTLDKDADENIKDLDMLQNKPTAAQTVKKANRNDPCPCGSEKKYKKCCGQNA